VRMEVVPVSAIEVHSIGGGKASWYDGVTKYEPVKKYSFEIPGIVSKINYRKGSRILYERVLARLDSSEQQAKVDELEASVEKAEVEMFKASAKIENISKQSGEGTSPAGDLNAARKALEKAKERVRNQRNKLQDTRAVLGLYEIRITLRGTISSVNVAVGDKVEAGQIIAEMKLNMPVETTVNIPNVLLSHVGIKSRANVRFKKVLKGTYPADVVKVGELSDDPQGAFPVTVRLRNPYSRINPGMDTLVAFRFDYRLLKKHIIVPHGSLGKNEKGYFVYLITPTEGDYGTIKRKSVVAGNTSGWGQNVSSGLKNGDLIVTSNVEKLQDGMQVKWK